VSEPTEEYRTPGVVIAAVAAATVVVPFLMVYAFLFIVRGMFVQVEQPDITDSRSGEAVAGLIALAFLVFVLWGMIRLLNGQHRLVFWLGQLVTAGTAGKLVFDSSSGNPQIPVVVLGAAVLALVLSVLPASTHWVRTEGGDKVLQTELPAASGEFSDQIRDQG
jgi:nitrate reductase NapE component